MQITIDEITNALEKETYLATEHIKYALYASLLCDRPLLVEGDPGVGKTSLAKALANGLGLPFIRVQMYEGLTSDQILYDYDYQKQLLTLEAIRPSIERDYGALPASEAVSAVVGGLDFFGEEFLVKRPVLRAIEGEQKVILFDEIDKAPEELEYMLYEFLENYSITIPQKGEIVCAPDKHPIVFLTSNNYRELSGALKRRCNYLYIEQKSQKEVIEILKMKAGADDATALGVAKCLAVMRGEKLRYTPSVSEAVEYARFLSKNSEVTKELAVNALGILIKDPRDIKAVTQIVSENGELLWKK